MTIIRMKVVRTGLMGILVLFIAGCTGLGNGAVPDDLFGRGTPRKTAVKPATTATP
jgi:hypothetical protein